VSVDLTTRRLYNFNHGTTHDSTTHLVQTYYKNGRSLKNTFRKIRDYFVSNCPHTIRNLIQKFESTGSVNNVRPLGR